jgi:hypothetical protein
MSSLAIARQLGVTDKTVAKDVAWLQRVQHRPYVQEDVAQRIVMQQFMLCFSPEE